MCDLPSRALGIERIEPANRAKWQQKRIVGAREPEAAGTLRPGQRVQLEIGLFLFALGSGCIGPRTPSGNRTPVSVTPEEELVSEVPRLGRKVNIHVFANATVIASFPSCLGKCLHHIK